MAISTAPDQNESPPPFWNVVSVGLAVHMALRGLAANRLRSFLTTLGVIIGVGAVIVAIGIGQGSREAVTESLQRLGTNVLTVMPGQQRSGGVSMGFGSNLTLKLDDADAILKSAANVVRVNPQVNRSARVKYRNKNDSINVNGVSPSYPAITNHPVEAGRFFTENEDRSRRRVALLGATSAKDLFGDEYPIGKTIRVADQNFLVIGTLKAKGGQGFRNPDDAVYVPVQTAMHRLFGMTNVQTITCQARSMDTMSRAQSDITRVLRKRHRLTASAANDFIIFNQADLASAQNEQQNTFSALITYLAIVSLGVGGIGIMNIMLVSVTERTREIGVRKAIGARRRDILAQFMLEALILSAVGGVLGVAAGIAGTEIVGASNNWSVSIQPATIFLAFSFSAVVGVFFGFYPAYKAAKLRPIEALHYE